VVAFRPRKDNDPNALVIVAPMAFADSYFSKHCMPLLSASPCEAGAVNKAIQKDFDSIESACLGTAAIRAQRGQRASTVMENFSFLQEADSQNHGRACCSTGARANRAVEGREHSPTGIGRKEVLYLRHVLFASLGARSSLPRDP